MKAIVWTKYGSPEGLLLREVEKPVPGDNDVLIRVRAATVTAGDTEVRRLKFPLWLALPIRLYMGVIQPRDKVLGQELAGVVEAVGKDVTQFSPGDEVFGATGFSFGAYAEYIRQPAVSEDGALAIKPTRSELCRSRRDTGRGVGSPALPAPSRHRTWTAGFDLRGRGQHRDDCGAARQKCRGGSDGGR